MSHMGVGVVDRDLAHAPAAPDGRSRSLDAALVCVSRFGLAKTTMDDIARMAGLSCATLYRLFPGGREEIVSAMVDRELARFFETLTDAMRGHDELEDRLVMAMTSAAGQLSVHPVLGFLLANEPELVLPLVSFSRFDRVLEVSSAFLAPYLADDLEPEDARRVGEWVTRLVLSHIACPPGAADAAVWPSPVHNSFRGAVGTPFALHPEPLQPERVRSLVRQFVLPGISVLKRASSAASSSSDGARQAAPDQVHVTPNDGAMVAPVATT